MIGTMIAEKTELSELTLEFAIFLYTQRFMNGYPTAAYFHTNNDNADTVHLLAENYQIDCAEEIAEEFKTIQFILELMYKNNYPHVHLQAIHESLISAADAEGADDARKAALAIIRILYTGQIK